MNIDDIIINGYEFYNHLNTKHPNTSKILETKKINTIYDNNNSIIKTSKYNNLKCLNENGDYACNSTIILEGIILHTLNKLKTSFFPKFIDMFMFSDKVFLEIEKVDGYPYTDIQNELSQKQKDSIFLQLLYILHITKKYKFVHNDLIGTNILIKFIEEDINYEGTLLYNEGVSVVLIDFEFSRITLYDTFIFNENMRQKYYYDEYDVTYIESIDLDKILKRFSSTGISVEDVIFEKFKIKLSKIFVKDKTKSEDSKNKIFKYVIDGDISKDNQEIFNYLIKSENNRLIYRFLSIFPKIKIDYYRINPGMEAYSKNRKIINKLIEIYGDTKINIKSQSKRIELTKHDRIYDPIMLEYVDNWLESDEDNIIINDIATKKSYFKDVPENNLISKVIFKRDIINYKETLSAPLYVDLLKYGIDLVINYIYLKSVINADKSRIFKTIDSYDIEGINYQYILFNPSSYYKLENNVFGFEQKMYDALKNYTSKWDRAMNYYLRSKKNDEEYLNDPEFLKYYNEYGNFPEEALYNIKENINLIDQAFYNGIFTESEMILYRGNKDCVLYDGINLGFISTTVSLKSAKKFKGNDGCIYEMIIAPGIPYVYIDNFSLNQGEKEVLLPRNLTITLKEHVGNKYKVYVELNNDKQFVVDKEHMIYHTSLFEGYNEDYANHEKKNKCYKNPIENEQYIDPMTADVLDNFITNDGMCYNIETIDKLFDDYEDDDEDYYEKDEILIVDHYNRLPFTEEAIIQILEKTKKRKKIIDNIFNNDSYNYLYDHILKLYKNDMDLKYLLPSLSRKGNAYIVELLLQLNINKKIINASLIEATEGNKLEIVKLLLNSGANIHINNDVIIILAVDTDNVELIEYLISRGANIHARNDKPLINAAFNGNLNAVKFLLDNGVDAQTQDNEALIKASLQKHLEVVKLLLQYGADIQAQNNKALINASERGHLEVVKFLLDNGADVKAQNNEALMIAANNGQLDIIKLLLEYKADIDAGYNEALIEASKNGHTEVVKFLLENGADVQTQNNKALIEASKNGRTKVVEFLLENGANIDSKALDEAVTNNKIEIVELLTSKGAKINNDLFKIAIDKRYKDILKILFKNIFKNKDDNEINSLVTFAIYRKNPNIIDYNNIEELESLNNEEIDVWTIIDEIKKTNTDIAKALLTLNIPKNKFLMFYTAGYGNIEIMKILFDKGYDIHIDNDETLMRATKACQTNMVKFLIDNGADIHSLDDRVLMVSIKNQCNEIIELLLDKGANIHAQDEKAFIYSLELDSLRVPNLLLAKGANIHARNEYALLHSIELDRYKDIEFLVKKGADVNKGLIPAIKKGSIKIVNFLIQKKSDIHLNDDEALITSVLEDKIDIFKLLLEKGANINARNDYLLKYAVENNFFGFVEFLLKNGANIHASDDYVLIYASQKGQNKMLKLLLENGANVHAQNDKALKLAKLGHFIENVKLIESYY